MKVLIVTEKCNPNSDQRDGGARVVDTLKNYLKGSCDIMQFGEAEEGSAQYHYKYPYSKKNRFERRLFNGEFIGKKVQKVSSDYSHVIYIHVSMQFGLPSFPLKKEIIVWTFPMFLTPSYRLSGETVPAEYFQAEKRALNLSAGILTPSLFEKRQIHNIYGIQKEKIFMVPRGIEPSFISMRAPKPSSSLNFCSVGSIKPQKNTLGLIDLFDSIRKVFPYAHLHLIGPIQNDQYSQLVEKKIRELGLEKQIEIKGFVEPKLLPQVLAGSHFHLSTSQCETFGRSIFETLASGIPNIVFQGHHAAYDFLSECSYIAFVDSKEAAISKIQEILGSYEKFSEMAEEIRDLYSDEFLGRLLISTLFSKKVLGVCDFDGTLFHKTDADKTRRSLSTFKHYPTRVICSARSLSSLLQEIKQHEIQVNWIIAHSGAVIADGLGNVLKKVPLSKQNLNYLQQKINTIFTDKEQIQVSLSKEMAPDIPFLRKEIYQEKVYYNEWRASKLGALCWLLKKIDWNGRVAVFGDGKYDREMITYFDGKWINPLPTLMGEQKELSYARSQI